MELIVKPTSRCNFACSFCSASDLCLQHLEHVSDKFKEILKTLSPNSLILTGGEPLCVEPEFYEELLSLGNWDLSFTSNLKSFYLNPEKWTKLLKHQRVHVGTSFQYGDGRRWDKDTPYSEEMFKDVMLKFKSLIGYVPGFIAVISNENEKYAMKHFELAKELGTKCKMNGMLKIGRSAEFYPMHKMVKIWLEAIELGYSDQMGMDVCFSGGCNINTRCLCGSTIRAIAFAENGDVIYSRCEDELTEGICIPVDTNRPEASPEFPVSCVSDKCYSCELFFLCNGCRRCQQMNKEVPEHCTEMLKMLDRIKAAGWRLQP